MNLREKSASIPEVKRYCKERCRCCYALLRPEDISSGARLCGGCQDAKTAKALGISYGQLIARRRDKVIEAEKEFYAKKLRYKESLDRKRRKLASERKVAKTPEELIRLNQQIAELDIERRRLREALGK